MDRENKRAGQTLRILVREYHCAEAFDPWMFLDPQ